MHYFIKKYHLSLVITLAIWILSLYPFPDLKLTKIPFIDKWTHVAMYSGLCTAIWWQYLHAHRCMNRKHLFWGAIVFPIFMSGLIELLQNTTGYRSGDWLDLLANAIGVLLASLFGYFVLKPILIKKV